MRTCHPPGEARLSSFGIRGPKAANQQPPEQAQAHRDGPGPGGRHHGQPPSRASPSERLAASPSEWPGRGAGSAPERSTSEAERRIPGRHRSRREAGGGRGPRAASVFRGEERSGGSGPGPGGYSPCLTSAGDPRPTGRQEPPQVGTPPNPLVLPGKHRPAAHKQGPAEARGKPRGTELGSAAGAQRADRTPEGRRSGAGGVAVAPWAPTVTV